MFIRKWSNEREAILRRMWSKGASASIIGDRLGFTRNAVIGKVHRLGLEARAPTFKHSHRQSPTGRPYHNKPPQSITEPPGGVSKRGETLSRVYRFKRDSSIPTKGELRRLFEEAWRNTAILQPTEN
jgi:hypothetical protein